MRPLLILIAMTLVGCGATDSLKDKALGVYDTLAIVAMPNPSIKVPRCTGSLTEDQHKRMQLAVDRWHEAANHSPKVKLDHSCDHAPWIRIDPHPHGMPKDREGCGWTSLTGNIAFMRAECMEGDSCTPEHEIGHLTINRHLPKWEDGVMNDRHSKRGDCRPSKLEGDVWDWAYRGKVSR